jgi:outer membrane protein TolC
LEAKREELHARMAAAEALRDYWLARTDLAKAVCGGLTRLDATLPSVKEVAPREDVSSSYAQQESE